MAKRLQDVVQTPAKKIPEPVKFELPKFELNLGFFINKGDKSFTTETLLREVFGDQNYNSFTPAEQMYVILKAMEDLEIIAPLELACPHCESNNNVAVNLPKSMKETGTSLQEFHLLQDGYHFKFLRPENIEDTSHIKSRVASIGLFMMQWLDAHNQGEDFDLLKMPLSDLLKILEEFGKNLFGVSFETTCKCSKCSKKFKSEFDIGLQDLVDILNEI